ncbi:MAG: autotransporter outer membrane beta-barrel domain-containing protein [Alphaproteobacteria bacterium]|nr:autotransporter outer membrane beta-barrel domain-containing protein [Alphaproteobacteria bacterium]
MFAIHVRRRFCRLSIPGLRSGVSTLALLAAGTVSSAPAQAADITVVGTSGRGLVWQFGTSWDSGTVPGAGDRAILGPHTVGGSVIGSNPTQFGLNSDGFGVLNIGSVWITPGSGLTRFTNETMPALRFYGTNGIAALNESTNNVFFLRRSILANDLIFRASNPAGGGFNWTSVAVSNVPFIGLDLAGHTATFDTVNAANTMSFSIISVISGAGNVIKTGAGILSIGSESTYTGSTTIEAGTLALFGSDGSIASSSGLNNNGAFDISALTGAGTSIKTLSGSGVVELGTKFLTLTNAHDTFAGTIQGSGGLILNAGTEILTGTNTYAGGTTIAGGTLQLGDGGTSGSIVGNVTDNGTLAFNRADTVTFNGTISGTGGVSQIGTGTTILNANNTYGGPTNVQAGTLAVGDAGHTSATLSGGGLVTVASGATLGGYGTVAGDVDNHGTVAPGSAAFGGGPFGSFTIGGNYTAHSTLVVNTLLNAGGPLANQFTDRLLILGNAGGHTTVQVNASGSGALTGAPTAASGISLVQVAGATSAGAFSLPGGYVTGGTPYQYHLNAYGPGSSNGAADPSQNLVGNAANYWDFRLQSAYVTPAGPVQPGQPLGPDARPALAPQVPAYITAPTALFGAGLQDMDQLHRRLGEIRDSQAVGLPKTAEFFARGYGNTMTYQSTRSFTDFGINASESYAAFQLGGSAVVMDSDLGMLRVGLAGSYGKLQFDPNAPDGFSEGNINIGKVSGIATFQSVAGWYLDGIVSGGWFNGSIGTTAPGQVAALNGSMVGASVEGGYPIAIGWQKLLVEPQVQVSWQHLMFDPTTDTDRINVQLGALDQGIVRAGARLVRPFETDDKRFVTPYLNVNLLQGFADNNAINVSGVAFNTGQYGTAIQVGGGVTGMLMANLAAYGDVSYQHEVSTGGFRGWAFNGGVRYSF